MVQSMQLSSAVSSSDPDRVTYDDTKGPLSASNVYAAYSSGTYNQSEDYS